MDSPKIPFNFRQLTIASQVELERLLPEHGDPIKAVLKRINSKPEYNPAELPDAIADLKRVELALEAGLTSLRAVDAHQGEYSAVWNVRKAANEVRYMMEDIIEGGDGGYSRGPLSPFLMECHLNEHFFGVNQAMGNRLSARFAAGKAYPWIEVLEFPNGNLEKASPESVARFDTLVSQMLDFIRSDRQRHSYSHEQNVILDLFEHSLEGAIQSARSAEEPAAKATRLVNPVAGMVASALVGRRL